MLEVIVKIQKVQDVSYSVAIIKAASADFKVLNKKNLG
jgi:hypothetical protein